MNYELAKELKDAGFIQFGEGHALIPNTPLPESDETMSVVSWRDFIHLNHKGEFVYSPALSELITAVKQKRIKITINGFEDYWNAFCSTTESASGKTPEEAVTKLWLALNRKEG